MVVYVDDMVLTGNDSDEMYQLQMFLASKFEMEDIRQLRYFVGIELSRSRHGISLFHRKYTLYLLKETRMLACKPIDTPMETNHKLENSSAEKIKDVGKIQRLVGKLIYLTHTRLDIPHAISVVSKFMQNPA